MVEIRNWKDMEHWLKGKPKLWAVAIAARSALRVVPVLGDEVEELQSVDDWRNAIILPVLRANVVSLSASKSPDSEMSVFASAVASRATFAAAIHAVASRAAFAAATCAAAAAAAANASHAAAADAATRAAAANDASAIWRAIELDAGSLEAGIEIWKEPLWADEMPHGLNRNWGKLKTELLKQGLHWQTVIQWYEDRLTGDKVATRAGRPSIPEMEIEIATLSNKIWEDAKRANEAIAEIQDRHWLKIPPQKPAALEPIWFDSRLQLPHGSAPANLAPPSLEASLTALKLDIDALVSDARDVGNIDQRHVDYLDYVAGLIPDASPDQVSLFRLGHAFESVETAQQMVADEWPDSLGIRHAGLTLAFDRTLKQFPVWKEFKKNASEIDLIEEQQKLAPELIAGLAEHLRDPDIAPIVKEEIPDELEKLIEPNNQDHWDGSLDDVVPEGRIIDGLESSSNIFKRLLEPLFDFFKEGMVKGKEIGGTLSRETTKALKKIFGSAIDGVADGAKKAAYLGTVLGSLQAFKQFGWLEPLLPYIEKILALL